MHGFRSNSTFNLHGWTNNEDCQALVEDTATTTNTPEPPPTLLVAGAAYDDVVDKPSQGGPITTETAGVLKGEKQCRYRWSKEDHRMFVWAIENGYSGKWRNISTKFITTRTPSQIASHAQKFFKRQAQHLTAKKRKSINDIIASSSSTNIVSTNYQPAETKTTVVTEPRVVSVPQHDRNNITSTNRVKSPQQLHSDRNKTQKYPYNPTMTACMASMNLPPVYGTSSNNNVPGSIFPVLPQSDLILPLGYRQFGTNYLSPLLFQQLIPQSSFVQPSRQNPNYYMGGIFQPQQIIRPSSWSYGGYNNNYNNNYGTSATASPMVSNVAALEQQLYQDYYNSCCSALPQLPFSYNHDYLPEDDFLEDELQYHD